MASDQQIIFGPFCFDQTAQCLRQGPREIRLRAKSLAVLQYLLEHPGRVISHLEFVQHVWVGTHVTRSVLRVCIWEIRQALGDSGATPEYIETVGQQGYRFCAPTRRTDASRRQEAPFVGREAELAALRMALAEAQRGRLQLLFVTGDPGIGKTALIHQFLSQAPATTPLRVGRGQCIEQFGSGEAYLPWLDALGGLGREPGGEHLRDALRHTAPMWLVHLPLLVEPGEMDGLQRQVQGMGSERMLRQLVEALMILTRETVVVLVLENLQWSDTATMEMLGALARRSESLRLLVLGTYRPAEVIAHAHPLRQTVQELMAHRLCQVLQLELFTEEQVQAYVAQRLGTRLATALTAAESLQLDRVDPAGAPGPLPGTAVSSLVGRHPDEWSDRLQQSGHPPSALPRCRA